ncbi:MAG TPA: cation:proton antiporter, partial [Sphingobacteriaceae bacterium]
MDPYIIVITLIGLAALGMAWMPLITQKTHISYSIVYVLLGVVAYWLIPVLPDPLPQHNPKIALHLSEIMVLISLMGTGLKIDQPFSFRSWGLPFRLIFVTMTLTIGLVAGIGVSMFGFGLAASILLGAALAPTDPVLASDVQVGPPLERTKNNVKFSLTAEAGMNDGMAFPFVYLAIALITSSQAGTAFSGWHW